MAWFGLWRLQSDYLCKEFCLTLWAVRPQAKLKTALNAGIYLLKKGEIGGL